ncbi:MAG: DNA polymerase I [Syntrophales bacterium]|nr:DNA polymerase I [Syntrophales bacterium]MDD5642538.1 DNA polymerase I [Syntrophales bacterium]
MAKEKPLLDLIDISSYIYRAYHAIRGLTNSKGFPTNAAFGVTNMLLKVLRERQPQYLALAFDAKGPTFRHREYAEYKAHRPPMPEELAMQLPYIHQIIEGLNLPAVVQEGFEADDLICTLVHQAKEQGFRVEIISGDKDLLPLVQEGVSMWDPMKDVRYDPEVIKEKYGLTPEELVDVRALAGDASDNIPGVPGIGEKTALKLIARYHSLENLLASLEEIKEKKLKSRLQEFADQARLSKKLTLLESRVPLGVDLKDLQPGPLHREALRRLFVELEFSKFNKELGVDASQTGAFSLVASLEDLERVAASIRQSGRMALFFVLGEQHPVLAPVAGLGLAWGEGAGVYLPFAEELQPLDMWERLAPLWTDAGIMKVGADLKAAMLAAGRYAPEPAGIEGDILLASYLLNPVRYEQNLENVALHYLGVNLPGPRELAGRPLAATELAPDLACRYGAERAETALRLWPRLQADLQKEGLWELYAGLELPLLTVLARMEARGMLLDQEWLRRFGQDLEKDMDRLEKEIYTAAGEDFLIQSPQQLSRILFDKLKIKPQKKTKGKTAYSTDSEVLQSLAPDYPIAAMVLEYRSLGKLKATYVDALVRLVDPETSRVHTTFVQSVAATGRLSSRDPNLQNIPVRGELGSQIRQAFVAPPGHVLLSGDYSQMELRLLAHFSGEPVLLKAFQEGVDIHRQTAAVVFGIHPELVTSEMRRQAKVINFGIIYGMSPFGLAKQLGVGQRVAQDFIQRYFRRHDRVKAYLEETREAARQQGWVTTIRGRRRQIPQINSSNRILRQEAERAAINTPLQGSAADIIKQAMLEMEPALRNAGLAARMLLQLHDELLFEAPAEELAATARVVRRVMEEVVRLQAPMVVELRSGENWGEMSPYGQGISVM